MLPKHNTVDALRTAGNRRVMTSMTIGTLTPVMKLLLIKHLVML